MVLSEHLLVLLGAVLCAPALSDVLFRCPPCSPERLAACPGNSPRSPCAELVRAPGCGCCPVCARLEGESCGVYTARCAGGLRCYPHPGSELPLQALVLGLGTCGKRRDAEYGSSQERGTEVYVRRQAACMYQKLLLNSDPGNGIYSSHGSFFVSWAELCLTLCTNQPTKPHNRQSLLSIIRDLSPCAPTINPHCSTKRLYHQTISAYVVPSLIPYPSTETEDRAGPQRVRKSSRECGKRLEERLGARISNPALLHKENESGRNSPFLLLYKQSGLIVIGAGSPYKLPEDQSDNMLVDNNLVAGPAVPGDFMPRKSSKAHAVNRERANEQHRSKTNKSEDKKRPARSLCQLQLDQVLERISGMHLPDDRGPLEHLYALPIPNCDKNGFFNLKQCKMSVNGQRGECWCVNPITGKVLPGSPTVRGDPECHLFYTNPEEERRAHTQRAP
ncbi:hypothetical protein XELAEV_18044418mg [Xenopus laevis]|uniref:Insulin-like growth factor-binding protein 2 n=1 Tax=Xenopus laevis TaxID=8355 RepID=A0A974H3S3_XENLA|nr:hypothetical protein XELAEV_18044418mg [Xenopus laevis]